MKPNPNHPPLVSRAASLALLLDSIRSLPPLSCADCGRAVRLEHATTVERAGQYLDLCPDCAALVPAALRRKA
jgi:hypothetical protein